MQLKLCEIVQNTDRINLGNLETIIKNINGIKDYAYIVHDKDDTRSHVHIALRLKDSTNTKHIASWFGVGENCVEKVKGRWSDMLKYLTHANKPEKYQYDESLVISNFDWQQERDRSEIRVDQRLLDILSKVDTEELREYNIYQYVTLQEYTKYKTSIESGFKYVYNRLQGRTDRKMEVIFITGAAGSGKTTYAKQLCDDKGYSCYISSGGKNLLDDYKGQDAVILDDLRGSDYKYNELLKLLDNNTSSMVASRYYNKTMAYCKLIVITSVQPMDEWYRTLQEHESEPLGQLKRRCKTYVEMGMKKLKISIFSPKKGDYVPIGELENPISFRDKVEDMTDGEKLDYLTNLFGKMADGVKIIKDEFVSVPEDEDVPFK